AATSPAGSAATEPGAKATSAMPAMSTSATCPAVRLPTTESRASLHPHDRSTTVKDPAGRPGRQLRLAPRFSPPGRGSVLLSQTAIGRAGEGRIRNRRADRRAIGNPGVPPLRLASPHDVRGSRHVAALRVVPPRRAAERDGAVLPAPCPDL